MQNMKKPETLPDILSLGEVKLLIDTLDNLKHKTIISVIYSCGRESVNI
jgi:site-specific recombinase XerD